MGVFQIRNLTNEKVFVGRGLDLPAIMNRHRFQLTRGIHQNPKLQADWNQLGGDNFAFEILDQLDPYEGSEYDYRADLLSLENERKLGREEQLRRIAANTRRAGR